MITTGGWSETGPQLWFAVAAGVLGPAAMLAFYKALALGPMGVISPLGVALPLGVGLVLGERPGILQFAGVAVAVAGVVLASGPGPGGATVQRQTLVLTPVAAFGFGSAMALIAEASHNLTGLFLALFVQRVCNVAVGAGALYASVRRGNPWVSPRLPGAERQATGGCIPTSRLTRLAPGGARVEHLAPITLPRRLLDYLMGFDLKVISEQKRQWQAF